MKRVFLVAAAAFAFAGSALVPTAAQAEVLSAGNGIYNVYVDNATGQYTVTTGSSHPLGEGLNVLFGDGSPGTSYDSIRSYTVGNEFEYQLPEISSQSTESLGNGFRTTYTLGPPEDLKIVQEVVVKGTTFEDSRVEVTTMVTNTSGSTAKIGVRYLWDYQVAEDDGPTFQQNDPNGPVLVTEQAFPAPTFDHYTIEDNDVNPSPPTFDVLGTVTGPALANPVPPTLLENVSWPESDGTTFDYTVGSENVSTDSAGPNDNAVLYYWGDNESNAPTVAPGGSYRASAAILLTRPGEGLPHNPPPPSPVTPSPTRVGPPVPPNFSTALFDGKTLYLRLKCPARFKPLCLGNAAGFSSKARCSRSHGRRHCKAVKPITASASAKQKPNKWKVFALKVKPKYRPVVEGMAKQPNKKLLFVRELIHAKRFKRGRPQAVYHKYKVLTTSG